MLGYSSIAITADTYTSLLPRRTWRLLRLLPGSCGERASFENTAPVAETEPDGAGRNPPGFCAG